MLNGEVEKLSQHRQNLGKIPRKLKNEVDSFVSAPKTRSEVKSFAMNILSGLAEKSDTAITSDGEFTKEKVDSKVKK